ncbi:hypothetical protein [Streptomyces agglomeratus]|uniref:hypothetical protein n=1 Tax=Streptomyces agglomeratus TaxID=285458 RepID=UPI00114CF2DF|nr:hypothetical protein [Streptomyces agglomeratus]
MKLPEIAIAVAIGSSLFTLGNMLVSVMTYRRVRPNVKVRLWRTGVATTTAGDTDGSEYQFILRFLNNGGTPVSVERIELMAYCRRFHPCEWELLKAKRFLASTPDRPLVPAHNGTTHRFHLAHSSAVGTRHYLRFRVTSGDAIRSRKVKQSVWLLPSD